MNPPVSARPDETDKITNDDHEAGSRIIPGSAPRNLVSNSVISYVSFGDASLFLDLHGPLDSGVSVNLCFEAYDLPNPV